MNNQQRISIILGWSSEELSMMMHQSAFTWMRFQMCNEDQMSMLSKCRSFWDRWVTHWHQRDEDYLRETSLRFLCEPLTGFELHIALEEYVSKHLVSQLNIRMNSQVTAELKQMVLDERDRIEQKSKPKPNRSRN